MSCLKDVSVYSAASSQRNPATAGSLKTHRDSEEPNVEFSGLVNNVNNVASDKGSNTNGRVDVDEFLGLVNDSNGKADENEFLGVVSDGAHPKADSLQAETADQAEEEEEELFELEEDIYSLMFIAEYFSTSFAIGFCVLAMQVSTLSLAILDMLKDPPSKNNIRKIPINVDTQVAIAQFLSLIIAVISQDDIFTSLSALFVTRYDEAVMERHPCATHNKWILTNLLRLTEGLLLPIASFFIVIQSSDVLDIFTNFAALAFISEIDNMVFFLAKGGYGGGHLQFVAKCTNAITLPRAKHARIYLLWCSMSIILALLIIGWSVVRYNQHSGYYLNKQASHSLSVTFGDEFYIIPKNTKFILPEQQEQNVTELAPFNTSHPPILFYSYFSGTYKAHRSCDKNSCTGVKKRLVYYERDYESCRNDPRCGKFYYCEGVKAWVFTIEALGDAVQEKLGVDGNCKWGWLLRSAQTNSYKLEDVPTSGWKIWTGIISTTAAMSVTSDECSDDLDCGLRGSCTNAKCECKAGWRGTQCNVKDSYCGAAVRLQNGASSEDFSVWGPQTLLLNDGGSPVLVYDRPIYVWRSADVSDYTKVLCGYEYICYVFVYSGRRWYYVFFCDSEIMNFQKGTNVLSLHGYWNNFFDRVAMVTDITESYTGLDISWFEIVRYVRDASLPFTIGVDFGRYLTCLDVDCVNDSDVCLGGTCKDISIEEFNTGKFATKGLEANLTANAMLSSIHQCDCELDFGGFFCESYYRSDPYVEDEYKRYLEHLYSNNRTDYEPSLYADLFWVDVVVGEPEASVNPSFDSLEPSTIS